jgi:hypothetical protein
MIGANPSPPRLSVFYSYCLSCPNLLSSDLVLLPEQKLSFSNDEEQGAAHHQGYHPEQSRLNRARRSSANPSFS